MAKAILVTGATGHQGGAVVDALLSADSDGTKYIILAVTRDASSSSATALLAKAPHKNLKLVEGNLDDVPAVFEAAKKILHSTPATSHVAEGKSYAEAAAPAESDSPNEPSSKASPKPSSTPESPSPSIYGVFSIQTSLGPGTSPSRETAQGLALIDAAIAHSVTHFVYTSVDRGGNVASWTTPTSVPHFKTKYEIEQHLRDSTAEGKPGAGMTWTVLRPVAFMDNLEPGFVSKVFVAALKNYLGEKKKKLQWVAVADIGVFAEKAFGDPEKWKGNAVGLAGDELTMEGVDEAFMKVTGEPAPKAYWLFGSALTKMMKEMRVMLEWFAQEGYKVDIEEVRRQHPGLLNMEEWLAKKSKFVLKKEDL
ncbi:hypothetical protein N0V88_007295 [Collariella sp. IMI 366227]|nr:hypothetical protein N0V88_007295 [Collariella sp. IMI 366227]